MTLDGLVERELFDFDLGSSRTPLLPLTSTVQLGAAVGDEQASEQGGCFSTPGKRIGNLTISTVRRGTSLLNPSGLRTPQKRSFDEQVEDKENICPRVANLKREYRFGGGLLSSPVRAEESLDNLIDWSKLEEQKEMVGTGFEGGRRAAPRPFGGHLQSEADEIESLLFSQDLDHYPNHHRDDFSDVFLGYEEGLFAPSSDTDSLFKPASRPRSGSMVSVASSIHSPRRGRGRLEIKVRSCRSELPSLKAGSQLRRMILPGDNVKGGDHQSSEAEDDSPAAEYTSFITKLNADELVESEPSDDEFREAGEGEEEDEAAEPIIPRREIEWLFAESTLSDPSVPLRTLHPVDEIPDPSILASTFHIQLHAHLTLLVQMLALCGEIEGAEYMSLTAIKLLSQARSLFPSQMVPEGMVAGLEALCRSVPDPELRQSLLQVKKMDPMMRPKGCHLASVGKFKGATEDNPYGLSPAYQGILNLFRLQPAPHHAFNPSSATLLDHTSTSLKTSRRQDCFLRSEDTLLLCGLRKYGLGNWEMIQAHFVPTRTAKQLCTRYKNLSARRAPPNPIKKFVDELWRPLSKAEETLIYRGVQQFGKDFKQISSHYLPHRPPTILRNLWERMDEARRQSVGAPAQ